jgi:maleylacetate reductase
LLPYAVGYLQPAVPDAARRLAQAMDASEHTLAGSIWELGQSVGTPLGLRSVGIREDQLPALTKAALARQLSSPRPLEYDSLYQALHAAWAGEPPGA